MGSVAMYDIGITDESVREGVLSATIDATARASTIKKVYATSKPDQRIIIDPHTANAVAAVEHLGAKERGVPVIVMETAKSFKFNEAMGRILGIQPPRPKRFEGLEERYQNRKLTQIADETELLAYIHNHTQARPKRTNSTI